MNTVHFTGIKGEIFPVSVSASASEAGFHLPFASKGESRESRVRIRSSFIETGLSFPVSVTGECEHPLRGCSMDLPIALAILIAQGEIEAGPFENAVVIGELSLSGNVRPVRGAYVAAKAAKAAGKAIFCARSNARECALSGAAVVPVDTLAEVVKYGKGLWKLPVAPESLPTRNGKALDMLDIIGQEKGKRAMQVAALGGHNVMLTGPPGAGKTMLARRFPALLGPLTETEKDEMLSVYSIAGLLDAEHLESPHRPFRAPHHTISDVGLLGSRPGRAQTARPGELTLAHAGVLFLDEWPEFRKHVIESLAGPVKAGKTILSSTTASVTFPARTALVASMNSCPCGGVTECHCAPEFIERYRTRHATDSFDIWVDLPRVSYREIKELSKGASTATLLEGIEAAKAFRASQPEREPATTPVERVARTIADLDASEEVTEKHIAEASTLTCPW